jgi:hypothetical protein
MNGGGGWGCRGISVTAAALITMIMISMIIMMIVVRSPRRSGWTASTGARSRCSRCVVI